jgi:hypothetical protein
MSGRKVIQRGPEEALIQLKIQSDHQKAMDKIKLNDKAINDPNNAVSFGDKFDVVEFKSPSTMAFSASSEDDYGEVELLFYTSVDEATAFAKLVIGALGNTEITFELLDELGKATLQLPLISYHIPQGSIKPYKVILCKSTLQLMDMENESVLCSITDPNVFKISAVSGSNRSKPGSSIMFHYSERGNEMCHPSQKRDEGLLFVDPFSLEDVTTSSNSSLVPQSNKISIVLVVLIVLLALIVIAGATASAIYLCKKKKAEKL